MCSLSSSLSVYFSNWFWQNHKKKKQKKNRMYQTTIWWDAERRERIKARRLHKSFTLHYDVEKKKKKHKTELKNWITKKNNKTKTTLIYPTYLLYSYNTLVCVCMFLKRSNKSFRLHKYIDKFLFFFIFLHIHSHLYIDT